MKFYSVAYNDPDMGCRLLWTSSLKAAQQESRRVVRHMKDNDPERAEDYYVMKIKACDIPTDRKGLLRWLNTYVDADNG